MFSANLTSLGANIHEANYASSKTDFISKFHIALKECDGDFVLDIMDETQTKGTHWHPNDVVVAVKDIAGFMEGKTDYDLQPFKQS